MPSESREYTINLFSHSQDKAAVDRKNFLSESENVAEVQNERLAALQDKLDQLKQSMEESETAFDLERSSHRAMEESLNEK